MKQMNQVKSFSFVETRTHNQQLSLSYKTLNKKTKETDGSHDRFVQFILL